MSQGQSTFFSADRRSIAGAALSLNLGYTTVPSGVYFDQVFTFTVWIYQDVAGNYARIIDFSNGPSSDNIIIALTGTVNYAPQVSLYNVATRVIYIQLLNPLAMLQWSFIAVTSDGFNVMMYINGQMIMQDSALIISRNINRTQNYIGKSSYATNGFSMAVLDDLRIYDRCLTAAEILTLYNA